MSDEPKVRPLPIDGNLVKTTPEEVVRLASACGMVMTLNRGGEMYRVVNPYEPGDQPSED